MSASPRKLQDAEDLIVLLAQHLRHAREHVPPPDDSGEFRQDDVDDALGWADAYFKNEWGPARHGQLALGIE